MPLESSNQNTDSSNRELSRNLRLLLTERLEKNSKTKSKNLEERKRPKLPLKERKNNELFQSLYSLKIS